MSRLERWSRRKRGESQSLPASPEPPVAAEGEVPPADAALGTADETLEPGSLDHTLPDPDSLPPGSDIKAYLVSGVSAGLRKRALRRLFAASHYNVRDGLDDYDEDFREKLTPLAEDVAERLRQWTRREADEPAAEVEPDTDIARPAATDRDAPHEVAQDSPRRREPPTDADEPPA